MCLKGFVTFILMMLNFWFSLFASSSFPDSAANSQRKFRFSIFLDFFRQKQLFQTDCCMRHSIVCSFRMRWQVLSSCAHLQLRTLPTETPPLPHTHTPHPTFYLGVSDSPPLIPPGNRWPPRFELEPTFKQLDRTGVCLGPSGGVEQ